MRFTGWTLLSLLLLVAGAGFYVAMGALHSGWTDIGVYSVAIVLLGFGLFGLFASARSESA